MSDYKDTLHLPKTSFPMRANLTKNEPKILKLWEEIDAYEIMIRANQDRPPYVLHDGPPYANGHIHMGTAMNKVLKDIVVKSKNILGYKAQYVPGWDCHGLPIEHKVEQELELSKKKMPVLEIRKRCREYATKWLDIQRNEFKRLGGFGVWDDPYQTMNPEYEAATARELGRFMAKGSVFRSKKPIYWCNSCQTALAEAEVEYHDHASPSIYVRFPLPDPKLGQIFPQADPDRSYIVIWTTTPWTIPSNLAVAVHPEADYVLVKTGGEYYIVAEYLLADLKERFAWSDAEVSARVKGADLEGLTARHPFYDRDSIVVLADYVTLETGTGCVHTAPGHGREDYETGLKYGLEILSPLDDQGRFLADVEHFAGMNVFEANPKVIQVIESKGNMLCSEKFTHSYPHCWRCKKPVIFRATTQWFISMEKNDLRKKALDAIKDQVTWVPSWGRERIYGMIENRPDWCISRQRAWGVPIIALLCKSCGEAHMDPGWVFDIVDRFEKHEHGADYWFEAPIEEIVPAGLKCAKCGATDWQREDDILDVWFDSGTSYAAVLEKRPECTYPADLYLEGTDQHRGWFHSSLLASIGARDQAPYRAVLTHGYVVDAAGRKMSKSVGNVIAPQEIIDKYGAEILRMWVAAENYQDDIKISEETLSRMVDAYRRIRNTIRFILGNLRDFDPAKHSVPAEDMLGLDRYFLDLVQARHKKISKAYDAFEYHKVFHAIHNLCATDLSAFYLDILKDRLYVSAQNSVERRSGQTVLWRVLNILLLDMCPVLSFTAEEAYQHLPEEVREAESVFALRIEPVEGLISDEERDLWQTVADIRSEATKAIEPLRQSREIGHSLDTEIVIYAPKHLIEQLEPIFDRLREVFIVSKVTLADLDQAPDDAYVSEEIKDLRIAVRRAPGEKCQRCWTFSEQLGTDAGHPDVCPRCAGVLGQDQA